MLMVKVASILGLVNDSKFMTQHTLAGEINLSGVGLHTGAITHIRLLPAAAGVGRYFVRVDLADKPSIPALVTSVSETVLSTQLGTASASVRTVEHLLASLIAMGVDNACIEIDGNEVPLLDGSARLWVEAIAQVGLVSQFVPRVTSQLTAPIWVYDGDAFVGAVPAADTRFTYGIDFDYAAIGNQWHSWSSATSFREEIAPARTFGLAHQIAQLQKAGLIKGGSLDNALVCSDDGWVNPPLRFANEPVRHKLLDLVGDLSLLGNFPLAHFFAYKASHKLHIQLAKRIVDLRT